MKKTLYIILLTLLSVLLSYLASGICIKLLAKKKPITADNPPPFFLIIGFSNDGVPHLLKYFEYSAQLKNAKSLSDNRNILTQDYGQIVYADELNKYSYWVSKEKVKEIIQNVDTKIKFPAIEKIDIIVNLDRTLPTKEKVLIKVESDEYAYQYEYQATKEGVTPLSYGSITRDKIWAGIKTFMYCFFFFELIGVVFLWWRWKRRIA